MHEYLEIRFRRNGKAWRLARQIDHGFEFQEADPLLRTIALGFAAADDGTRYRMQRIRQVKGWRPEQFDLTEPVEDGVLVIRGADRYSLPEGWYSITADVSDATVTKIDKKRVEIVRDGHGVVTIDLEADDRNIAVDLTAADPAILGLLQKSTLNGLSGVSWVSLRISDQVGALAH